VPPQALRHERKVRLGLERLVRVVESRVEQIELMS
jgi:hypothetical protein